jgi:hypothetical protein
VGTDLDGYLGQLGQHLFEVADHVDLAFLQGVQDGHQDPTGMSPSVRLGPEADFAGDDGRPQIPFGEVILG